MNDNKRWRIEYQAENIDRYEYTDSKLEARVIVEALAKEGIEAVIYEAD